MTVRNIKVLWIEWTTNYSNINCRNCQFFAAFKFLAFQLYLFHFSYRKCKWYDKAHFQRVQCFISTSALKEWMSQFKNNQVKITYLSPEYKLQFGLQYVLISIKTSNLLKSYIQTTEGKLHSFSHWDTNVVFKKAKTVPKYSNSIHIKRLWLRCFTF